MYDIYSRSADDGLRFLLGRAGASMLYVVGLNPSTANQESSDTTVAKVEAVADRHGYDGFVMLNLYPARATDFNTLPRVPDVGAAERNLTEIEAAVREAAGRPTIWAAWGQSILSRPYFVQAARSIAARLAPAQPTWLHFGPLTRFGHPRHPSRLAYNWSFATFDVHEYLAMPRFGSTAVAAHEGAGPAALDIRPATPDYG